MIFVTGDTHIPIDIKKLNTSNFPEQKKMTKNDYVIICGDFGLYWKKDKEYKYWRKWLLEKNFTVLWIDGNHENFDWINQMPIVEWHNGLVHKDENIIHLMRGNCYNINGYNFLALGGALSVDKEQRQEHVSWWQEEQWSFSQTEYLFSTLERIKICNDKIDYVISHTCPASILNPMTGFYHDDYKDSTRQLLDEVLAKIGIDNFKHWYFGHWHIDKDYKNFSCLYHRVVQID